MNHEKGTALGNGRCCWYWLRLQLEEAIDWERNLGDGCHCFVKIWGVSICSSMKGRVMIVMVWIMVVKYEFQDQHNCDCCVHVEHQWILLVAPVIQ